MAGGGGNCPPPKKKMAAVGKLSENVLVRNFLSKYAKFVAENLGIKKLKF